jgi:hypothetical protein
MMMMIIIIMIMIMSLKCGYQRACCSSPGDIRAWSTMVECYRQDKPMIHPDLSGNPTSSHPVAKQEKQGKEINFAS